ncbi:hypothetical protein [Streptomyces sp. NPDC017941]|uniref:hypothetical protein n=1 Tax=Streptomyces sp. NPDC017941 TaxID=3365018 RepID=UPI0037BCC1EA
MAVSVTRGTKSASIHWTPADDPQGYLIQAIDSGRLEKALTALGLKQYDDLAALEESERADILRATSQLATELTRRVRHMTVAAREDGMTWGTLASTLTDDPHARSTARGTYQAGLRQMGRPTTDPADN